MKHKHLFATCNTWPKATNIIPQQAVLALMILLVIIIYTSIQRKNLESYYRVTVG